MTRKQIVNALYKAEEAINELREDAWGEAMLCGSLNLSEQTMDGGLGNALRSIEKILHDIEGGKKQ